jgi:hypothetical protein
LAAWLGALSPAARRITDKGLAGKVSATAAIRIFRDACSDALVHDVELLDKEVRAWLTEWITIHPARPGTRHEEPRTNCQSVMLSDSESAAIREWAKGKGMRTGELIRQYTIEQMRKEGWTPGK